METGTAPVAMLSVCITPAARASGCAARGTTACRSGTLSAAAIARTESISREKQRPSASEDAGERQRAEAGGGFALNPPGPGFQLFPGYGMVWRPKGWGGMLLTRLALPYPMQVFQEAGGGLEVGWPSLPYHTPRKKLPAVDWRRNSAPISRFFSKFYAPPGRCSPQRRALRRPPPAAARRRHPPPAARRPPPDVRRVAATPVARAAPKSSRPRVAPSRCCLCNPLEAPSRSALHITVVAWVQ